MARPRSDDKRSSILEAAVRVIVEQGLSAPTATIAREAGVANGSLFTYFETKSDLYNQLYLELKREMADAALEGLPSRGTLKNRFARAWSNWIHWAARHPNRRRALVLLGVSDDVTAETRRAAQVHFAALNELWRDAHAAGAMQKAPFEVVASLATAVGEATVDVALREPARAEEHCKTGFEAVWRMIG